MGVDPQLLEAAQSQLERELSARQIHARGCGLALVRLSAALEGGATLERSIDALGVLLLAYAARGRRLLRAAYRLLDADDRPEAVPLLRILSEYLIVGSWLRENPERLDAWALADLDRRDYVIEQVADALVGDAHFDETREALQEQREELAKNRTRWVTERGEPTGGVPTVETMATEIGLGFAYQLGYRVQSQSDVHATPLAADQSYERLSDGRLRLRSAPGYALSEYDQYELGAHTLRDVLAMANAHVPGLLWRTGLDGITAALNAARESDPRKHADSAQRLVDTAQPEEDTPEPDAT